MISKIAKFELVMYTVSKMTVNKRLRIFYKNVWEKVVVGKALPTNVHFLKK